QGSVVTSQAGAAIRALYVTGVHAPAPPTFARDAVSVDEAAGTITFTVTRTGDAQGTQSVSYALSGSAGAADVSDAGSGSVSFAQIGRASCRAREYNADVAVATNENDTGTLP